MLKCFIYPCLTDKPAADGEREKKAAQAIDFGSVMHHVFHRECNYTFEGFMIASTKELEEVKEWMKGRPGAKASAV